MQKFELIQKAAEKCSLSQEKTKEVIDCVISEIINAVTDGDTVTIHGFGSFRRVEIAEKKMNFRQKTVTVPRHYAMRFRVGTPVKAALKAQETIDNKKFGKK